MIEVKHLTKTYGDHDAIRDLNFRIVSGRIYGLLGPNGAGKSTTMNIMTGCLAATSGTVNINGFDIYERPVEAKRCIGYLPELPPLYTDMTPREYLTFVAEAKRVAAPAIRGQVESVMEATQITDMADRLIRNLSKGYRQRVGIAQAMLGDPDIIILDEPTVGLDPKQLVEIRDLIAHLGEKRTVIISSHILSEISEICDELLVISGGRLVASGPLEELQKMVGDGETLHLVVRGDEAGVLDVLAGIPELGERRVLPHPTEGEVAVDVRIPRGTDVRDRVFFAMADRRYAVVTMETEEMTLESVFLALTENGAGETESPAGEADSGSAAEARPGRPGDGADAGKNETQTEERTE